GTASGPPSRQDARILTGRTRGGLQTLISQRGIFALQGGEDVNRLETTIPLLYIVSNGSNGRTTRSRADVSIPPGSSLSGTAISTIQQQLAEATSTRPCLSGPASARRTPNLRWRAALWRARSPKGRLGCRERICPGDF